MSAVDGGKLLEWVDKVAYAVAARWSGRYCVTAYVGDIRLQQPIAVGDLVELHAELVYTGRTSMHILVTVYTTDPTKSRPRHSAQCLTVFVAVGENVGPVEVPSWTPATIRQQQRQRQARARITLRRRIATALETQEYTELGTAPTAALRFLAAPSDVNWGGKVHGGRTMTWINEAAYVCAADWSGKHAIASYIAGIRFYHPIAIGNTVEATARLLHTGPRSMHFGIHVTTCDKFGATPVLAAHGIAVFVTIGDSGQALPVEPRNGRRPATHSARTRPHRSTREHRTVQRPLQATVLTAALSAVGAPRR
jgi:acyl-CoA hydrolase